jgi:hypothetical protein
VSPGTSFIWGLIWTGAGLISLGHEQVLVFTFSCEHALKKITKIH